MEKKMTLCTPEYLRELARQPTGNVAGHRDGLRDAADEIERLSTSLKNAEACISVRVAEVERLRAWAEDEQQKRHKVEEDRLEERSAYERLRTALRRIVSLDEKNVPKYAQEIAREAISADQQGD